MYTWKERHRDMPLSHVDRALVYVAGPYIHPDPVENTHIAIKMGERLDATGIITAYVPHLSLLSHMVVPHDADFWYDFDLAILNRCDALFRIPGQSTGADNEVIFAEENQLECFYEIGELTAWAESYVTTR